MGTGSGQLARGIRAAVLLAACAALVAMTSGLLLAVHTSNAGHAADHDSHDCTLCRHLLLLSKESTLAPIAEPAYDVPVVRTDTPELAQCVETRCPQTFQPRGPPCSYHPLPV